MKPSASKEIVQLRQLLAEKFPHLRTSLEAAPKTRAAWPTGLPQLDSLLHGGLPKGAITELVGTSRCNVPARAVAGVSDGPAREIESHVAPLGAARTAQRAIPTVCAPSGSALLFQAILRRAHETNQLLALIDGRDSFDATALDQEVLSRLLWVRCQNTDEALKATDILLRDRNLPLIVLDLKMNPAKQLRKISGTVWYRLQRIVQQTTTAFVVVTPFPMVSGADARIVLNPQPVGISALSQEQPELLAQLKFELTRWGFEQPTEIQIAQAG